MDIHSVRLRAACRPKAGVPLSNFVPAGCTQQPHCSGARSLLIATAPEEFGVPACTTILEAAGLCSPHRWGIILPNSSRVSMLSYQAIVAVRYPKLVLHESNHIYIGHFVPHESTVAIRGFRTVLWKASKDLRSAVKDVVAFCTHLKNYYRNLQQGATSQLLVLCNRTAVHNLLLQHGFQTEWYGGCEFPPPPLLQERQLALLSLFKQG